MTLPPASRPDLLNGDAFIRSVTLDRDRVPSFDIYPFSIPSVTHLNELVLDRKVTFFIGDNGSGKSTLIEAIAVAAGFNPEGGSKHFRFSTRSSESPLHRYLRLVRGAIRWRDGFFLRAESYFNLGTQIEALDRVPAPAPPIIDSYGGQSLHEQSHGEAFLALATRRFGGHGVYILDEPEAALSPMRQLSLLQIMRDLVERRSSQFLIATHSPILMAYPGALLYQLTNEGLQRVEYRETEHYQLTRAFLEDHDRYLTHLFQNYSNADDHHTVDPGQRTRSAALVASGRPSRLVSPGPTAGHRAEVEASQDLPIASTEDGQERRSLTGVMADIFGVVREFHELVAGDPRLASFLPAAETLCEQADGLLRGHRTFAPVPHHVRTPIPDRATAAAFVRILNKLSSPRGDEDPVVLRGIAEMLANITMVFGSPLFEQYPDLVPKARPLA